MKSRTYRPYGRPIPPVSDEALRSGGGAPLLPFAPGDFDRSALRMRLSDFGRLLGVPKQTVTDWKRTGKITTGADGLLDPREAVRQLLRNTDPARLRVRVLAPILAEVRAAQANAAALLATIADLRAQLAQADEDCEFHEQAAAELLTLRDMLKRRVLAELDELAALPPVERAARLDALDAATFDELEGRECLSPRSPLQGEAGPFSTDQPTEDNP